ncbi:CDP-glycerol glycerophosphotransferase family protein [Rahnella laticis]|uniref:CDP-glycerol glycerophosphotransferase family protein n=1 Tax=Rahnella laticis TaxID=2787622 RepID=UPI0018A30501|nr:CDP-glycerol glycerophosphotransferase family protein [Rahnella laticis]MBF7995243.1 CDP-glycerol glycerophosphotransferase family protein [Rahnella laticis]
MTITRKPVGFYMETSFHFEVYKNVIAALQAQNIPCALVISDVIEATFVSEMVGYLQKLQRTDLPLLRVSVLTGKPSQLSCLVSPYYTPLLNNLAPLNVRALYGLAKDRWGHAWWNAFYDCVLCYAEHTRQRIDIGGNAVVVGNPRFDDWHNAKYDRSLAEMLNRRKKRPTLLYAPTFGELSSLPHWAESLNALQNDVTLLVKLHHGTLIRSEEAPSRALVQKYFRKNLVSHASTFSLLEAADMVVTDNSGFIFDAIHADKKTLLLGWKGLGNLLHDNRTLSDVYSTDQTVREFLPQAASLPELRRALSEETLWPELSDYRRNVCDAFQDGNAGKRAANEIIRLLDDAQRPQRNFLLQSLRERLF